jgi:hypothetical protein
LGTFPLLLPAVTFAQVIRDVDALVQRKRFLAPDKTGLRVRQQLIEARTSAANCQFAAAMSQLAPVTASGRVMFPDSVDVDVWFSKLIRRLQLKIKYPQQVQSDEFCVLR